MQYSWRGTPSGGSTPSTCGQPDLRHALGKLFTSSSDNKAHASSYSDYFRDILHSASNLDWEFKRLDLLFSSKVNHPTFQPSDPSNNSVDDFVRLHKNVRDVLKLIRNLKKELKLREHLVGMEGHNSSLEIKFVIQELEAKLYELVSNVDEIKTQLPFEFELSKSASQKFKNHFGEEESRNKHFSNCDYTPNRHQHCKRIKEKWRENDFNEVEHDINRYENFEKQKLKNCLKHRAFDEMETNEMQQRKTHCTKEKNLTNHSFHELQGKKVNDENRRCLRQKQYQNPYADELQISKKQCKRTRCLKQKNLCSNESQQDILPSKEPHCLKQKQCLRRPKKNEDPLRVAGNHQSVMQLYIREPFNVKSSIPHIYRVDGFEEDTKNKIVNTGSYISENGHTSEIQCKKKKVRKQRRERTRAGKDFERKFRSESNICWKNNEFTGVHDDTYNNEIGNISGYLYRNNNFSSSFKANSYGEEWEMFDGRKKNDIILTAIRFEPDGTIEKRGRRRRRRRQRKQDQPRLDGGALRSMFSVNRSPKRRRKLWSRHPERKRSQKVTWKPSKYSVNSSRPSRRRDTDRRRRKRRRKDSSGRPVQYVYTNRERFQSEKQPQREIMRYFTKLSDDPTMSLERDEVRRSFPTALQRPCPTDCSYPQYASGYRPIPYPMRSNTYDSVTSPEHSERYCIHFDRPRKKKIVKRYLPVRRGSKLYHEVELESQYSTEETQSPRESFIPSEESKSCTDIPYFPETECQPCKYYKQRGEQEVEYDRFECEPPPMMCRDTSTEMVSTEDTSTSTCRVIKAVRAVATNTTSVATTDSGVSTDIEIPCPPPPETMDKHTNTKKLRRRSVGTDAILESIRITTDKGTDTPQLKKINRETNTVAEKVKKVKDVGTNPRPEEKKKVMNVGTGTVKTRVESKFTNTIPVAKERKRMPSTVSKGTQVLPDVTAVKQTSYDKVKTRDDATETIPTKMIHKGQKFENIDPVKMKATLTEQTVGHKQVLESQRFENLQTLSKQSLNFQQVVGKRGKGNVQYLSIQTVDYVQNLSKQPVGHVQQLDKQTAEHLQTLGKTKIEHFQTLEKQEVSQLQHSRKQRRDHLQILEKQRTENLQITTKRSIQNFLTQTQQTQQTDSFKRLVNDFKVIKAPPPPPRTTPAGGTKIGAALQTAKKTEQPVKHVQVLSKNRPKHILTKKVGKLEKSEQQPGEIPVDQCVSECPSGCQWIIKESSSNMSVYLTVEKIHEEVFRKRCRYCKCSKQCGCKCCNNRSCDQNIIVCEKKKSNTIRITNKSECKLLKEGEKIASDIDVDVSFNVADSRSEVCFKSGKNEERVETEPEVLGKQMNVYYTSSLNTSAFDIHNESGGDWKYTNY